MRNKSSVQSATVLIILSILTVFGEFALLQIMKNPIVALSIGCGMIVVLSILILLRSYNFEMVFIYSLLNVLFSSLISAYSFWEIQYFYYSVKDYKLWLVICNFCIPFIVCLFAYYLDGRDNLLEYSRYFRNASILFYIYYAVVFIYIEFTTHTETIWTTSETNLIPFYSFAGYIEDYIYNIGTLKNLITHVMAPALLFVPFGFLLGLLLKGHHKIIRFLLLFLLPLLTETLQYIFQVNTFNIDDAIYALLGGFIGQLIYMLLNFLSETFKGRTFLEEERSHFSNYRF